MNTKYLVIYQTQEGDISIDVLVENDSVWLTQVQMAQLFDKDRRTVNEHIGNIFKEGELEEEVVCRKFRHTTSHGSIKGKTQEKKSIVRNFRAVQIFINVKIKQ